MAQNGRPGRSDMAGTIAAGPAVCAFAALRPRRAGCYSVVVADPSHPVVLFDGTCNLCNASVQFVLRRDPRARFRFAALQSQAAGDLLAAVGWHGPRPDSVALVAAGRVRWKSSAALAIARGLRWPWPLLAVFVVVPRPLRDVVYDFVARRRLRWFGKQEACMVPTKELRARFLDAGGSSAATAAPPAADHQ
jgi:predicted DCC family thiol-disulfide oxidoreductase YuxK